MSLSCRKKSKEGIRRGAREREEERTRNRRLWLTVVTGIEENAVSDELHSGELFRRPGGTIRRERGGRRERRARALRGRARGDEWWL